MRLTSIRIPLVHRHKHTFTFDVKFEPRDMWVGLYWKRYNSAIELFFCLLPMLPIVVYWQWFFYPKE